LIRDKKRAMDEEKNFKEAFSNDKYFVLVFVLNSSQFSLISTR
jgi:hypothetical protein